MAEGVKATLAPDVGPVERDDRRDTGFFSGGVLSTPADFQQSRRPSTRECSPTFCDMEGTSDDFATGVGPPTSLGGFPPIPGGLGTWPGILGIGRAVNRTWKAVSSATSRFVGAPRVQPRKTNAIA